MGFFLHTCSLHMRMLHVLARTFPPLLLYRQPRQIVTSFGFIRSVGINPFKTLGLRYLTTTVSALISSLDSVHWAVDLDHPWHGPCAYMLHWIWLVRVGSTAWETKFVFFCCFCARKKRKPVSPFPSPQHVPVINSLVRNLSILVLTLSTSWTIQSGEQGKNSLVHGWLLLTGTHRN